MNCCAREPLRRWPRIAAAVERGRRARGRGRRRTPRPIGSGDQHAGRRRRRTVSRAPPSSSATTGVPHAWASTGTMPKSSIPGSSTARACWYSVANLARRSASPGTRTSGAAPARCSRASSGPVPDDRQRHRRPAGRPRSPRRAACRARARTRPGSLAELARGPSRAVKVSVYRRIHNGRPAIIVSADPAPQHIESSRQSGRPGPPSPRSQRASPAITGRSSRLAQFARPEPGRNTRRTDPRRSASASGSSRRARPRPARSTDFTAQWLLLMTRS